MGGETLNVTGEVFSSQLRNRISNERRRRDINEQTVLLPFLSHLRTSSLACRRERNPFIKSCVSFSKCLERKRQTWMVIRQTFIQSAQLARG